MSDFNTTRDGVLQMTELCCQKCSGPIGIKYVTKDDNPFHPECIGFTNLLDPNDFAARLNNARKILTRE